MLSGYLAEDSKKMNISIHQKDLKFETLLWVSFSVEFPP